MKTEIRKKEKCRFNGSLELRTVRGRDREREREKKQENSIPKTLTQNLFIHVCVFNAHFYTSPYKD